jgi:hypothetical protein
VSELTMLSMSGSFLDTPSPRGSNAGLATAAARTSETNLRMIPTSPLAVAMTPTKTPLIPTDTVSLSPGVQQVYCATLSFSEIKF